MKVDNPAMELWERLREARTRAKVTQQQIADACGGLSREAVSQWESRDPAKRSQVSLDRLRVYAKVCGVSLESLLGEAERPALSQPGRLDLDTFIRAVKFMQRIAALHGATFDPLRDADLFLTAYEVEARDGAEMPSGNLLDFGEALRKRMTNRGGASDENGAGKARK